MRFRVALSYQFLMASAERFDEPADFFGSGVLTALRFSG